MVFSISISQTYKEKNQINLPDTWVHLDTNINLTHYEIPQLSSTLKGITWKDIRNKVKVKLINDKKRELQSKLTADKDDSESETDENDDKGPDFEKDDIESNNESDTEYVPPEKKVKNQKENPESIPKNEEDLNEILVVTAEDVKCKRNYCLFCGIPNTNVLRHMKFKHRYNDFDIGVF